MEARVVALPVRENSYSGATTVLLQAMALGKPVVVTRTKAIETGYGLVDGENCRLVAPGDDMGFERASPECCGTSSTRALSGRAHARRWSGSSRGIGTCAGSRSCFATQSQHLRHLGREPPEAGRLEVRRELGGVAGCPVVHLDEDLADHPPGLWRSSEHDPHSSPSVFTFTTSRSPRARASSRTSAIASTVTRAVPTSYSAHVSGGWSECAQEPDIRCSSASPRSAPTAEVRMRQSAPALLYASAARSRSSRFALSGSNEITTRAPCARA